MTGEWWRGQEGKCAWHGRDRWASTHNSIYHLVMVFEVEGSLPRPLEFETPVTRGERVLFGPVKMT